MMQGLLVGQFPSLVPGRIQNERIVPSQKTEISSNVVSVFQAGAFWGIIFYPIGEIWGRKLGLILSAFLLVLVLVFLLRLSTQQGWHQYMPEE